MRQPETHINRFRVSYPNGSGVFSIEAPLGRLDKAWEGLMKTLKEHDKRFLSSGLSRVTNIEKLN